MRTLGMTTKGEETKVYTLKNTKGMQVEVSDLGATIVSLEVPDKDGNSVDVVLGFDSAAEYEESGTFFGSVVGRVANRTGNATFTLNGKEYKLPANSGVHNLHSGPDCWKDRVWTVKSVDESKIVLALHSPDGDQGFPGAFDIEVTYTVTEENELTIHYHGVPDADTVVAMTNHAYFNLNGHASGDILDQEVWLNADSFTYADEDSIVTGEIIPVDGTPMDFRVKKTIGRDIDAEYDVLIFGKGYDHNWCLNGTGFRKVAEMSAKESGITMEVYTDKPGVQMYVGNYINGEKGKGGVTYKIRQGVCFETQLYPNAINHEHFQSPIVKAGEVYESTTTYKFV